MVNGRIGTLQKFTKIIPGSSTIDELKNFKHEYERKEEMNVP
jgi:hypothetical protein